MNSPKAQKRHVCILSRNGMSMLNVIILLMLVGVLITAGIKVVGPLVQRSKINDTKTTINSNVDAITSWAVTNCRIPDAGTTNTGFEKVAQNPNDAWGNKFAYLYAPELANSSSCAQICGLGATKFFVSGISDSVAFVISSSQYSSAFHNQFPIGTKLNGTALTAPTLVNAAGGYVEGTLNQQVTDPPDILRIVTLNELKARIGCAGYTQGQLRILNNELPKACNNKSYQAQITVFGGTPGYTYTVTGLPPGLTASGATISGTVSTTGPMPQSFPVVVSASDSQTPTANTAQRSYTLKVISCTPAPPASPGNPITFNPPGTTVADNWNGGTINDQGTNNTNDPSGKFNMTVTDGTISAISIQNGTTANCVWYQRPLTLTAKKLRAYFKFTYEKGPGFAFAMVPAASGQTIISSCDENSLLGFGPDIPGTPILGAEFIVNDWNSGTGPGSNCIAVNQEVCVAAAPGINSWATGATPYHVRIELDTTVPNPIYKVWLTSDGTNQAALKDLSTAYNGVLLPVSRTLINVMDTFFLGFTTGQHGNDRVSMTLTDLKFELY